MGLKKRASKGTWEALEGKKGRRNDVIAISKMKIILKNEFLAWNDTTCHFTALNATNSNFSGSIDNIKDKARGTNFLSMN